MAKKIKKTCGTAASNTTYVQGCRCDDCKAAHAEYGRRYRANLRAQPIPEAKHGTISGYIDHGCRCSECQEARRSYYGDYHRRYHWDNREDLNPKRREYMQNRRAREAEEYEQKRAKRMKKK